MEHLFASRNLLTYLLKALTLPTYFHAFYAWKQGLKTGMYYLRTQAAAEAIKFTVDQSYQVAPTEDPKAEEPSEEMTCSLEPGCLSCSG